MSAFRHHKTDAAYIGRIIAGYGHIEFLVGHTVGYALASKRKPTPNRAWLLTHRVHYEKVGVQLIYQVTGAERRLRRAKTIARKQFENFDLKTEFSETFNDVEKCRISRNLFAHAVYDWSSYGLYLTSLERAAKRPGVIEYELQNVPRRSLKQMEAFFARTLERLQAMNEIFSVRAGLSLPHEPSMPKRPAQLREHTSLFPFHSLR